MIKVTIKTSFLLMSLLFKKVTGEERGVVLLCCFCQGSGLLFSGGHLLGRGCHFSEFLHAMLPCVSMLKLYFRPTFVILMPYFRSAG